MAKLFITGDTHGDFRRFSFQNWPASRDFDETDNNSVIICGDFGGIWDWRGMSKTEQYWLSWLDDKPFQTLFICGNHENFNRLNSNEFEIVDFSGAKAQKISDKVFRLLDGQIYSHSQFGSILTIGGAVSYDKQWRVPGRSWWPQEVIERERMEEILDNLEREGTWVDFVISHCAPTHILSKIHSHDLQSDIMTQFIEAVDRFTPNKKCHYFGHYHTHILIDEKYQCLYQQIIELGQTQAP